MGDTLANNLELLFKVLPLDRRTPLSAVPKVLLSLFAGNSTDALMAASIERVLPIPLDTSKNLAQTIDALLPLLPLPLKNWTTDKLSDTVAQLLRVLPIDSSKALPEVITSLFRAIFPASEERKDVVECKNYTVPEKLVGELKSRAGMHRKSFAEI